MSSGARSSGSSAARSSQRISAISAEGRACQAPGAVKTVAWICVAASLAASANQMPRSTSSSAARTIPTSSASSRAAVWAAVSPASGLPPGCMNLSVPRLRTVSRRPASSKTQTAETTMSGFMFSAFMRASVVRRSTDVSSWSLAGPVTSHW